MPAALKRTVVLAAVVLGLLGIHLLQQRQEARSPEHPANPLQDLTIENISGLGLQQGKDALELTKAGQEWRMKEPADRADMARITAFLGDLKNAEVRRIVSSGASADLATFGLDEARGLRISLQQPSTPATILRLAQGSGGDTSYIYIEGGQQILELAKAFRGVTATADVWRDHAVFGGDMTGITEIELRGQTNFILRKNGADYILLKQGKSMVVPGPKAAAYLATVVNLHATGFVDANSAPNITKPVQTILVRAANRPELEAKVGTKTDTGDVAVKTNQRQIAFTISGLDLKSLEEPDLAP